MLVACIALVDDLAEFVQVQIGQLPPNQVANNDPIQGIIGLLQSGLGIVTGITFLKWIYRAYKNIQGFGAEAKDYDIRIENRSLGAGVRITGDRPLSRVALWAIRARANPLCYGDCLVLRRMSI